MHILRETITSNISFDNHSKKVTTEIKMPSSSAQQQNNIIIFFTIVWMTQESTAMENQYNKRKYLITNKKNWSVLKFVKIFKCITILIKKKKVVPAHVMNANRQSNGTAPFILNLDTWLDWVVNFMPQQLLHLEWTPEPTEQEFYFAIEMGT